MTQTLRMLPWFRLAFAALVVAVLIAALYQPGMGGGFFFDDDVNIVLVESLQVDELTIPALQAAGKSGVAGPAGRPIAQLSFALNYYFSGFDPFAFKATNLAIHLIAGGLVFLIARQLLLTPLIAGLAAMLWLLHPIQVTSVLYVVQRMTSLSALFLLAGFLLHMVGRERDGRTGALLLLIGWGLFWPLSFLSKESGVLFPLFVLAWELIIRRNTCDRLDRFARVLAAAAGIGGAAVLLYALLPVGQWLWAGYQMRGFSLLERLLTEGRVLWFYLGQIVFPRFEAFGLYHDDIALSTDFLTPWTTLPAWLGLFGMVWLAWWARRRAPLVSFGIVWFLVGHSLESTVLPLEIAHEHRNYLPSIGIVLVGAWTVMRLLEKSGWQRTLGIALAVVMTGYCGFVMALRAHQFGEQMRRTQIEAQHHPLSARTHFEAGRAIVTHLEITSVESPQYSFARTHYQRAGELAPDFKLSWLGLIHLNCLVGVPVDAVWVEELSRRLKESPFGPGDRNLLHGVKEMSVAGTLCLGRYDVERLFAAAGTNPTASPQVRAILHSWLADYLTLAVRDLPAAEAELKKSLAITPQNASNRLKQVQLAYLLGRHEEARTGLQHLKDARLTRSEMEIMVLLNDCLAEAAVGKCSVK